MNWRTRRMAWLPLLMLAASCSGNAEVETDEEVIHAVYVVNYPLKFMADRISSEWIEVHFPAPRDVDPAYWSPDAKTIQEYQKSSLTLLSGAGYARWVKRASLPRATTIDVAAHIAGDLIKIKDSVTHTHGPGGEHSHDGFATYLWLDPQLAIRQAEGIARAMDHADPAGGGEMQSNLEPLLEDLESLDELLTEVNKGYRGEPLLASHPVYQYLARRCNWNLKSLHWEPNQVPTDAQWTELSELLKSHPAKWIVWEAPPKEEIRKRLEALGVQVVVFYPCANKPEKGNFLTVMRENIERLRPMMATASGDAQPGAASGGDEKKKTDGDRAPGASREGAKESEKQSEKQPEKES